MNARHRVSVVIPVYNVSRYLDQCLMSVEAQPYPNIEIVCVNDGSTDDSLKIMRTHAERDPRYVVIDKVNEGYGASCNRGIDASTGDYVAIVEPDDWVEGDMYGDLLAFADGLDAGPVDVIESDYWRIVHPDTDDERRAPCAYTHRVRPPHQPFVIGDAAELLAHHPSIWTALYRRAWLDERGIRFREYPGAGWADNPWLLETLCQAERIAYVGKRYYCYREDTEEKVLAFATRNPFLPLERLRDMQEVIDRLGVTDPRVLAMQDKRVITYCTTAIQANGLDHPGLRDAVREAYLRLDHDRLMANRSVSPAAKRLFCKMTGRPAPKASDLSYVPELLRQTSYRLRTMGLRDTLDTAAQFLRGVAASTGAPDD